MSKRIWKEGDVINIRVSQATIKEAEAKRDTKKYYENCKECVMALACQKNPSLRKFKDRIRFGFSVCFLDSITIARFDNKVVFTVERFDAKYPIDPFTAKGIITESGAKILNTGVN